eukprot:356877-Chlamydomonas_euryale.AAC.4
MRGGPRIALRAARRGEVDDWDRECGSGWRGPKKRGRDQYQVRARFVATAIGSDPAPLRSQYTLSFCCWTARSLVSPSLAPCHPRFHGAGGGRAGGDARTGASGEQENARGRGAALRLLRATSTTREAGCAAAAVCASVRQLRAAAWLFGSAVSCATPRPGQGLARRAPTSLPPRYSCGGGCDLALDAVLSNGSRELRSAPLPPPGALMAPLPLLLSLSLSRFFSCSRPRPRLLQHRMTGRRRGSKRLPGRRVKRRPLARRRTRSCADTSGRKGRMSDASCMPRHATRGSGQGRRGSSTAWCVCRCLLQV